jgi:hypothetical protein
VHIQNVCSMRIKINKIGKQEVGIWWVQKRYPRYGVPIWSLWPNIRFLPSIVAEKNEHICSMCIKINKVGIWWVQKHFPRYRVPIWSLWPNIRFLHIEHICSFFSATIDGRNLIFGHKLHIGTPYRGKRFWTHQIPTSCLPILSESDGSKNTSHDIGYLYEACDQISDFCHLRKMRQKISWTDGRTERGKTIYPPPPSGSGVIIKIIQ